MTTEPNTYDPTVEIEHILGRGDAHRRGHFWLRHGQQELAYDYFRLGSRHGLAAAEEDLAAMAESGNTRAADCPDPSIAHHHRARRRPAWLASVAAALLAAMVGLLAGWLARPVSPAAPAVAGAWVPTDLSGASEGPRANLDLGTAAPPWARVEPGTPPITSSPAPVASRSPAPAAAAPPAASEARNQPLSDPLPGDPQSGNTQSGEPEKRNPQTGDPQPGDPQQGDPQQGKPKTADPLSDPHISVSRDDDGETFTALVPLDGAGGWRRLRFPTAPGSEFRATLWSAGSTPCRWRFAGLDSTESDATGARTGEIRVDAGERRDAILSVRDWPVLSVEVRGGGRAADCLLVNQRIMAPSPSPAVSPTTEKATASPPAPDGPTARLHIDPAGRTR
jgi:hypothetical protein